MEISDILTWVFRIIETEIMNVVSIWFVIGLLFFCAGLFFIFVFAWARLKGRPVQGTLVGAIMQVRIKQKTRDGKPYEKRKETIWPIFEYLSVDQRLIQEVGSEGINRGGDTYTTGQKVDLLVCSHTHYDDVYDANKRSALYVGFGLIVFGGWLMSMMLIPFGLNAMFWMSVIGVLGIGFFQLVKNISQANSKQTSVRPLNKQFSKDDIQPVESYYKPNDSDQEL